MPGLVNTLQIYYNFQKPRVYNLWGTESRAMLLYSSGVLVAGERNTDEIGRKTKGHL